MSISSSTFSLFINTIIAFTLGRSSLVFLVANPIHSILSLIGVFFLGTCLLFFIQIEYYARLFLIVYVGAIVVLFLFIIRILELKIVNITQSLYNSYLIHYSVILCFFLIALLIVSETLFNLRFIINSNLRVNLESNPLFIESNMYFDWSKVIQRTDQLHAIGGILYTEYKVSVILASILLFLSRVGALALTLFFPSKKFYKKYATSLKVQDNNNQTMRFSRLF
jgi:NADH:ubiquinone oxidoreductase subunit 6 (subunit J)